MKAIIPEKKPEGTLNLSLLDLNKQIIGQQPDLDIDIAKKRIQSFKLAKNETNYFMLLSNEINYFTVFNIDKVAVEKEIFEDVVIECLQTIGIIKEIEVSENDVEIWVKKSEDEVIFFKLFDYDWGVVECL
jgi:sporulation protein YlmC with PRC-barrel domain